MQQGADGEAAFEALHGVADEGRRQVLALATFAATATVAAACLLLGTSPVRAEVGPGLAEPATSAATRLWAARVLASRDHGGAPFAVVDKHAALIVVHHGDGRIAGVSRVLLGARHGDHSMPGVGERTQRGELRPEDLTTPAGRFDSKPGKNRDGETVVWVDHDAAFAIHRLRGGPMGPDRARRLASASLADKRASAGCVVVPVAFWEGVVEPVLGARASVVYVLPEDSAWTVLWETLQRRVM